ncbi:PKD domain-containing protein [Candidatus Alkanophaga liquidiphilum]
MRDAKLLAIFVLAILVAATAATVAQGGVYVIADASVSPDVIQLGETTRVTITLTGNGTPEISFPLDVALVMDCSGSMNRYGTIITDLSDVTLTTSYQKVGEFTVSEPEEVEVMLQTLPGRGYGADVYFYDYDYYYAYLKNKDTGATTSTKGGYSVVRWGDLQPGTYEVYAKLYYYHSGYTQPQRTFCAELPPVRTEGAKDAANEFVDLLKSNDRAALVKFHSSGWSYSAYCTVVQSLTTNKNDVKSAINGLSASGGTPMGEGLDRALDHLEAYGREDAVKAIILLTDGWWNLGVSPLDQAQRAANDGIPIYVIGWGGVNYEELTQIAETTGGVPFFPATSEDLRDIYRDLAVELSNITAKDVVVTFELAEDVEYAGGATEEPQIVGNRLVWNVGELSANETWSVSFDVKPLVSGSVVLNTGDSEVTYEDAFGEEHEVPLPQLSVAVTAPPVAVATASPNETYTYADITFDGSASYDVDGVIVAYEWDFGDGNTASGGVVTHQYADDGVYTATLTVTDDLGATNSTTVTVEINNRAPSVGIVGPEVTSEGDEVQFEADASDLDGEIIAYEWNFGDDATGGGQTVTHTYATAGNYTVILTVTDDDGAKMNATHEIRVLENLPPVAVLHVSNTTPLANQSITLDASGSYDPDGYIAVYRWDFNGDGNWDAEGNVVTVSHAYSQPGGYTVVLEVEDNCGKSSTTEKNIIVSSGSSAEMSGNVTWNGEHALSITPESPTIGQPVTIDACALTIKNNKSTPVTVRVKLCVDGMLLAQKDATLNAGEEKDVEINATWVPMASGMHEVSLHVRELVDGAEEWIGPTNDPAAAVRVRIKEVS